MDGEAVELSHLRGLVEAGELDNLRDRRFAVQYDALFLVPVAADADPYAYADIATRTLDGGLLAAALNPLLGYKARVNSTFGPEGEQRGNLRGIVVPERSDAAPVVFEDVADSGLAFVHRQVVSLVDADGNRVYGLRDVFDPR